MYSAEIDRPARRKRVVVTGVGAVTPLGVGAEESWQAMLEGRSGVGRITRFDPDCFDVQIAAEVKGFDPTDHMTRRDAKRMDRFAQFAVAASRMALNDAGVAITAQNATKVGVLIGSGIGGLGSLEAEAAQFARLGPSRVSPILIPLMVADMASGYVSILTGARGPSSTVVTACATGANALGDAAEVLRRGQADVMIAGASEATITPLCIATFANSKAMTARFNDCPQKASRPFDRDRSGMVIGEGAGIVILETLDHARRRGAAHIYAELTGYGLSSDAFHITHPSPDGEGIARALRMALEDAATEPEEVNYVNAHGTSTPLGDPCETQAYKAVFGEHARRLPISSIKSMTGHMMGAAGAVEAIACVLAIDRGLVPPTINYEHPDPECDLDYVPNRARALPVDVALSNNSGFGGHNVALVFRRLA